MLGLGFWYEKNLAIDIILVVLAAGFFAFLVISNYQSKSLESTSKTFQQITESQIEQARQAFEEGTKIPAISMDNWPIYQTQWYGFELKYPENWNKPVSKSAARGASWKYRYEFRRKEVAEDDQYIGFDVIVYDVKKVKELSSTDEFPAVKDEELKEQGACQEVAEYFTENENYPADRVYVSPNDGCYYPTYFFTLTREEYMYNVVPVLKNEEGNDSQTERKIIKNFPEFISAASTFNLIDIKKPAVVSKPKITAPKPVAGTKRDSQGRRVCAEKHDNPGKSDQHKKKHLDMECCLDPDEYPNPHCYYPPEKYGKYL